MKFLGIIGIILTLGFTGFLVMKRHQAGERTKSSLLKKLQKEQEIELPSDVVNSKMIELPGVIKKDLEKKVQALNDGVTD